MQVLASQLLYFLATKLAVPPLLWPVNCIKIGGHVALLSGPNICSVYVPLPKSFTLITIHIIPVQCTHNILTSFEAVH